MGVGLSASLPQWRGLGGQTRPGGCASGSACSTQVRAPRHGLRAAARGRNGPGCDLVLTLFRRPEMSDAQFAADAEWVMRDLEAAKRLLERSE
jgi:hypothetical protein